MTDWKIQADAMQSRMVGSYRRNRVEFLGYSSLLLFALSAWLNPILNHLAFALLVISSLMSGHAKAIVTSRQGQYVLLCMLYVIALSVRSVIEFPDTALKQTLECAKWLLLGGFFVVAYWVKADTQRINQVLLLMLAGLLLGMLLYVDGSSLVRFDTGTQAHFQFTRGGIPGLASCSGIFGLILFAERLLARDYGFWRARLLAWLVAMYLLAYMLIASQSRISWLGLVAVALPILLFRSFRSRRRGQGGQGKLTLTLALLAMLMLGAGLYLNADYFVQRTAPDLQVLSQIADGSSHNLTPSSFGYRYHMLRFGLEKWLERPWFGWGNIGSAYLARLENDPRLLIPDLDGVTLVWFSNLHNTYIEILLRYGLVGLILAAFGWGYLTRELLRAGRSGGLPRIYVDFFLGCTGILLLYCVAEHRATREEWRVYWFVLAGCCYTVRLWRQQKGPGVTQVSGIVRTG